LQRNDEFIGVQKVILSRGQKSTAFALSENEYEFNINNIQAQSCSVYYLKIAILRGLPAREFGLSATPAENADLRLGVGNRSDIEAARS
jgi:hypothetical protein